jgi:hypothetical protein
LGIFANEQGQRHVEGIFHGAGECAGDGDGGFGGEPECFVGDEWGFARGNGFADLRRGLRNSI